MTISSEQRRTQWTPSWNAWKLLNLSKTTDKSFFNCVGDTQKGRRCGCQIARHNVQSAEHLLSRLPRRSLDPDTLYEDLEAIAYKLLCVRWHRDSQVERMVKRWRPIIVKENARARARSFETQTKNEPKDEKPERVFKQEEADEAAEQPQPTNSKQQSRQYDAGNHTGRSIDEQYESLRREKERSEEARRQSQREREEQKEAKARAERKRHADEEARRRREQQTPPRPSPPKTSKSKDWADSWAAYRHRWTLVAALPHNSTVAELEAVFPWPLRDITQPGLCIAQESSVSFEKDVQAFFSNMPKAAGAADDNKSTVKALRKESLRWHPDKVLVQFPVGTVPKTLQVLATKVMQVLNKLMSMLAA